MQTQLSKKRILLAGLFMFFILDAIPSWARSEFQDKDLDKLLSISKKTHKKGLIYIWSPHMPLSLRGVHEAKKITKSKGIELTVVLDPYASADLAAKVATRESFPKAYLRPLESRVLLEKNMTLHFPSVIPYRDGTLARDMRGGYDNPKRLASYLEKEFEKLRYPASLGSPMISTLAQLMGAIPSMAQSSSSKKNKTQPLNEICRFAPFGVIQRTAPRRATSYFFRTFPDSQYVSYAGVDDPSTSIRNHNYILNLKSRKEYRLPGPYDPVPICEEIMTVPNNSEVKFFDIKKILSGNSTLDPIAKLSLSGVYQSVSSCPAGGQGEVTMITDAGGVTVQKVQVDINTTPPQVSFPEEAKLACQNFRVKFPMLSKDGKELSGADQDTNTTKIWHLEDDGTCTELFDFHFLAGKADFSFDGTQVVFHVRSDIDNLKYFSQPSKTMAMNIYLYDRVKKSLRKITNNYDRNSYYPVFRRDGTVVYMDMTRDGGMSFVWLDPKKSPEIPFDVELPSNSGEAPKDFQALVAIGRTWYELCADFPGTTTVAASALTALSLDEDECKDMVLKNWSKFKNAVVEKTTTDKSQMSKRVGLETTKGLTEQDLLAACPAEKNTVKEIEVLGDIDETIITNAQNVIETKCMSCHSAQRFNDPQVLTADKALVKKMLWRISEKPPEDQRMPLGTTLPSPERKKLKAYLEAFLEGKLMVNEEGKSFDPQSRRTTVRFKKRRPRDLPPLK
jgi:hypothetical protein